MILLIHGIAGRMGREVARLALDGYHGTEGAVGVDAYGSVDGVECFSALADVNTKADCIVDFSNHTATKTLTEYAVNAGLPLVVCTTGQTDEEIAMIHEAAKSVPVFFSANMSVGIALLVELAKTAARAIPDAEIEIIEKHHNKKLDAPSGTALMIAEELAAERDNTEFVYDRQSVRRERSRSEIGIHSVRGGTIVGEHEVIFAGNNEIVTLSHTATSREIFANGAVKAAEFVAGKPAGMYDMSDVINVK